MKLPWTAARLGLVAGLLGGGAGVAGVAGAVIWGRHRDSAEIQSLRFPVFSTGSFPLGPNRTTQSRSSIGEARLGSFVVKSGDFVFADLDGVLFVPPDKAPAAVRAAQEIVAREQAQAKAVKGGTSLRKQFQFEAYLQERRKDPTYTLRTHLRKLRAEIEV